MPILSLLLAGYALPSLAADAGNGPQGLTKLCVIYFDKDAKLPARVEDTALSCLLKAKQLLADEPEAKLYLVATADQVKDNVAGHGRARAKQDMTGADLRYADVAAYRAINTKTYLVRWMGADPTRIVPFTSYEDGQWAEFYVGKKGIVFKTAYGKAIAPILSRPCTVKPCAMGPEEFLIAQLRERISAH